MTVLNTIWNYYCVSTFVYILFYIVTFAGIKDAAYKWMQNALEGTDAESDLKAIETQVSGKTMKNLLLLSCILGSLIPFKRAKGLFDYLVIYVKEIRKVFK